MAYSLFLYCYKGSTLSRICKLFIAKQNKKPSILVYKIINPPKKEGLLGSEGKHGVLVCGGGGGAISIGIRYASRDGTAWEGNGIGQGVGFWHRSLG